MWVFFLQTSAFLSLLNEWLVISIFMKLQNKKTGVLLVNLGTPDSPGYFDVASYLAEFLTDKRVIDTHWILRQLLVRFTIIPSRLRQSTNFYKKIWTKEGSPLKVYGHLVESMLKQRLGDQFEVRLAMRYQNPSLKSVLDKLRQAAVERLIVIPLFPQYASATTGSVHECVMSLISKWDCIPQMHFVSHYETDPHLIDAFCLAAKNYPLCDYDHILFSFHGLPQAQIRKADLRGSCLSETCCQTLNENNHSCYSAQCYATAGAIAKQLSIDPKQFSIAFQSRLGKDPWLQPYTGEKVHTLARNGVKRMLVFCPSFVCDCLETIYEIGVEYRGEFIKAGGLKLDLVPGLNATVRWIDALENMVISLS